MELLLQEIDSEKTVGDIAREGNRNGGGEKTRKRFVIRKSKKQLAKSIIKER